MDAAPLTPPARGVLLDFDGVISPDATRLLFDAVHEFIALRTPISRRAVFDLCKAVSAFPMRDALRLLLDGLGLGGAAGELGRTLRGLGGESFRLAPGFAGFWRACHDAGLRVLVCSTMDRNTARAAVLDGIATEADFLPLGGGSKAAPDTYRRALAELDEPGPDGWLLVDDAPAALRAARLAGAGTVLMAGEVFTAADAEPYREFIDATVASFAELAVLTGLGGTAGTDDSGRV